MQPEQGRELIPEGAEVPVAVIRDVDVRIHAACGCGAVWGAKDKPLTMAIEHVLETGHMISVGGTVGVKRAPEVPPTAYQRHAKECGLCGERPSPLCVVGRGLWGTR